MLVPDKIRPYLDRPVAVLGHGVSGRGLSDLLRAAGIHHKVYDERDSDGVHRTFGPEDAAKYGLVVYSPGFPQNHPWLSCAREAGCRLLGELDLASLFWGGALIAVTGTNGKTTVTEFLAFALKRQGIHAVAAGNIGYPLSRMFEAGNARATTAICEVSSFQCESLELLRPQALIWTNFDEDHLDRHGSMRAYFEAKWRLVEQLARPCLIVGSSVEAAARSFGYTLPDFTEVVTLEGREGEVPPGTCFNSLPQRENYLLLQTYWKKEGHSLRALHESARLFRLPAHRLARTAQVDEVSFWNDSKATNFGSTLAALKSFRHPVIWIGGGKYKGGDVPAFAKAVAPSLRQAWLIGETAPVLKENLEQSGVMARCMPTLEDAVRAAFSEAGPGSDIVLSPGFASLDQFSGYAERGIRFEKAVLGLKKGEQEPTSELCAVISKKSL